MYILFFLSHTNKIEIGGDKLNHWKEAAASREAATSREETPDALSEHYGTNLSRFRELLGTSADLVIREFTIDAEKVRQAAIIYLENLVAKNRIHEDILRPLTVNAATIGARNIKPNQITAFLQSQLVTVSPVEQERTFSKAVDRIFSGDTILMIEGINEAFIFATRGWAQREVGKPESEETVRGPREGFVETLGTNVALLRRRIHHSDLMVEAHQVGQKTKTAINIVYLKGVVNEKIVAEIRRRLARIQTDGILGSGYIEQLIGDAPISIFSTTSYSERPDAVGAKILEGRAAILIDGSPEVLTVPALFIESFQNPDDYNSHPFYATLIRWVRYIAFAVSIFAPAVYIALASYNQELIPTPLFITMVAGAEVTPYPTFIEVVIIGLLFEIFREAGIRFPRPYGQGIIFAVAFVLAQAPVTMGLVGEATVVVVALTAMASLVVPKQADASILIRLLLAILASVLGAYGILLGLLGVLAHLVSLRSFGVPYLAPIAPFNIRDFKQDVIQRTPLWAMLFRPRTIGWHDPKRQKSELTPAPPDSSEEGQ